MRPTLPAAALAPAAIMLSLLTAAAARDAVPPATPNGKPESCIPLQRIEGTRVHGDRTIDFIMRDRKVYRNVLPYDCPSLGAEESFSYATSLSELCSTDIITVLYHSPIGRGASCGLGQFQPVTLAR